MGRGPLELVVIEFPGELPGLQIAPELRGLVAKDVIRIVDVLFARKQNDGTLKTFELHEQEGNEHYEALDRAVQAVDGLITEQDVAEFADDLPPGGTAGFFLFEHAWAHRLTDIVNGANGLVAYTDRIPGPVVDAIESAVRRG